jgi:dolichol-phosphate mannosyltransferase
MRAIKNISNQLWEKRGVRFLLIGGLCTLFNLILIVALVNLLNWNSPFWRSLANLISTEICLILSFFVYRKFVWQVSDWQWSQIFKKELPAYHLSALSIISARVLVIFPLLDLLGVHYAINTTICIALGSILSYVANEKLIFKS